MWNWAESVVEVTYTSIVFSMHVLTMMMMTFITQRGESQGKTKKERKATKSEGSGLEEGASRALMRQYGEGGCGARMFILSQGPGNTRPRRFG